MGSGQDNEKSFLKLERKAGHIDTHLSSQDLGRGSRKGQGVQDHPQLYGEFQVSLGSVRSCLK